MNSLTMPGVVVPNFFAGGGNMAEQIHSFNWSKTSLGAVNQWPQSLQTALTILLHSKLPMQLFWGPELLCFYNDAFQQSIGRSSNFSGALGKPATAIDQEIKIKLDGFLTGEKSTLTENVQTHFYEDGKKVTLDYTCNYFVLFNELNKPAGVLVTCIETVQKTTGLQALEESNHQLEFAIEATELATWDLNPVTNKFTANARYTEWFGVPAAEETDNELALKAIAEKDRNRVIEAYAKALDFASNYKYDIEYTICPDGKPERVLKAKGKAWFGEDKIAYRFNGTLQDVTAQVKARKKLEENEEQLRIAAEGGELGTFDFFPQTGRLVWSAKTKELFGLPPDAEVDYNVYLKALHPNDKERSDAASQQAMKFENGGFYENEYRTIGITDGKLRWVRSKGKIIFDQDGQPIRFTGVTQDITERKLTEEALQNSEILFRTITDASPIALWMSDENGKINYINQTWLNWTGKSLETQLGTGWLASVQAEDRRRTAEVFAKDFEARRYYRVDFRLKRPDGKIRWCVAEGTPRYMANGQFAGYAGSCIDITQRKEIEQELRRSENYFRQLTDTVPAIIWITEPDGSCSYLNKHWYDFTGQTKEEAEGFGWLNATHPADKEEAGKAFVNSNNNQTTFSVLYRLRNKQGEYRWAIDNGSPRFNAKGEYGGMIGTVVDVHEKVMAEEMLRYRKALLEAHNEASLDGILLVDAKGKIISYNQRFIEIWSMPQTILDANDDEAALSFAMTQLVSPQQFLDRVKYLYENPTETSVDELEYKDGKIVERHGYPVIAEDGTYYAWSWKFRDITQQKGDEKAVKEREENFRQLANLVPQIIWTAKPDGFLDYYNKRWYDYTGFKEGYGDQSWVPILHPDDIQLCIDTWYHSVKTGKPYQMEYRFIDKETGGYRWFLGKALPIKNEDGTIAKWFGTCTDIHDQKAIEEKLEALVTERTTELQRSNEDLQQFAHVASHDLKEPVRKIKTFSNRLNEEFANELPDKARLYINKMGAAANRMYAMIDGVLLYSTVNALDQTIETVDLNNTLRHIEEDLEVMIQQHGATLKYSKLPVVEGSGILLHQLFYNLINNSLKFSKKTEAPLIQITAGVIEGSKPFAEIVLTDNGIGFDPDFNEKIFKTFARLNSKDQYEGTGLGLSLCKKIVERHGGTISATGQEGKGAVFTITLPLQAPGFAKGKAE